MPISTRSSHKRRVAAAEQQEEAARAARAGSQSKGKIPVNRVPTEVPAFTVKDLRRAIPAHCFKHSLAKSFGYLAWDLAVCSALFYASLFIEPTLSDDVLGSTVGPVARFATWAVYWVVQGAFMTGLWVIGHECGHGGFASSSLINNVVGLIVHSALLVPFFAWKISHRRHHSNTGSLEHDEVFVPAHSDTPRDQMTKEECAHEAAVYDETPSLRNVFRTVHRLFMLAVMFVLGWPLYLLINATGHSSYPKGRWVNHFLPSSPIFSQKEGKLIIISDLGLVAAFVALYKLAQLSSFSWVMYCYGVPYLMTNFWLVFITFNQHTDEALPHYNASEWDWLRGALATVDRNYGVLNHVFHHIGDTHVAHHLFSMMPFYHAEEATEALKKVLGDYYRYDDTNIFKACWKNYALETCRPDDSSRPGVMWFKPPQFA